MKFELTKDWLVAAITRAVKTAAQVMLGMVTVGAALSDINWVQILSVAAVSAIYSILTSIVMGLPEAQNDGTIILTPEAAHPFAIEFKQGFDEMAKQSKVSLTVTGDAETERVMNYEEVDDKSPDRVCV